MIKFLVLLTILIANNKQDNVKNNSIFTETNISKNYLLGKVKPENDPIFAVIPEKYCKYRKEYIHKDVLPHFIEMYETAKQEGIELKVVSAFRSFETQKWLWNQKVYKTSDKLKMVNNILQYTAMPGTSRHHWGTDLDLISIEDKFFETSQGIKAYNWLCENANKYGFFQVYTKKTYIGYKEEKWHWTYLPISKIYLENYKKLINYSDLQGFNACETASQINVFKNYVFAIDSLCLDIK